MRLFFSKVTLHKFAPCFVRVLSIMNNGMHCGGDRKFNVEALCEPVYRGGGLYAFSDLMHFFKDLIHCFALAELEANLSVSRQVASAG